MGTHYVCKGGCGGVSDAPGVCQAVDCRDHGKPLKECGCQDGVHRGMKEQDENGSGSETSG